MHYNTLRYYKRRKAIIEFLGGICVGCGGGSLLEIHHKNPKTKSFDISSEFSKPWEELLTEVNKCELRCASCHKGQHKASHGLGMYSHQKCRCDICRSAWSARSKVWKANAKLKKQSGMAQR